MTDRGAAERRQDQDRRTTAARRGVRIAGAVGAAGAALAIGAATAVTHAADRDDSATTGGDRTGVPSGPRAGSVGQRDDGRRDGRGHERGDDDARARAGTRAPRPPQHRSPGTSTGGLATQGGSGPSHSSSSGS